MKLKEEEERTTRELTLDSESEYLFLFFPPDLQSGVFSSTMFWVQQILFGQLAQWMCFFAISTPSSSSVCSNRIEVEVIGAFSPTQISILKLIY